MLSDVQQKLFDIILPKYHALSNCVGTDRARINCESEGEYYVVGLSISMLIARPPPPTTFRSESHFKWPFMIRADNFSSDSTLCCSTFYAFLGFTSECCCFTQLPVACCQQIPRDVALATLFLEFAMRCNCNFLANFY